MRTIDNKNSGLHDPAHDALIADLTQLTQTDASVRRTIDNSGRVNIDRRLPFLCLCRTRATDRVPGVEKLITGEASYLVAEDLSEDTVRRTVAAICEAGLQTFGAFLVLEVWAGKAPPVDQSDEPLPPTPHFQIWAPQPPTLERTVESLQQALGRIKIHKRAAEVLRTNVTPGSTAQRGSPSQRRGVIRKSLQKRGVHWLGLEVTPIWAVRATATVFPVIQRLLCRHVSTALQRSFFRFTRSETTHRPRHFHSLGKRALVRAAWRNDEDLAEIGRSFDMLLLYTPVNGRSAERAFVRSGCEEVPRFLYRPMPVDLDEQKRRLHNLRLDRVEDPTLHRMFRNKRNELDAQLTLLTHRDTPKALFSSLVLYERVKPRLLRLAEQILETVPSRKREAGGGKAISAHEFAHQARAAMRPFEHQLPGFKATVDVRPDIGTTLMVSRGRLLVGEELRVPPSRVAALLAHEVGTHVLTYLNGKAQPLHLLYSGTEGYDELQEGLAVLAEYLVGGLSAPRMRLLAARVITADLISRGATFVDAFRHLHEELEFGRSTAFQVTLRIYRGGGLVKDAIYLRGLARLLEYLGQGGELEPLFVGKISAEDVPVMLELQRRGVLQPTPLTPDFLLQDECKKRLARIGPGTTPVDLFELQNPTSRKRTSR